jgi:hypothetical protein
MALIHTLNRSIGRATFCLFCLAACALIVHSAGRAFAQGAEPQRYQTAEAAAGALREAAESKNEEALARILGPAAHELIQSGDPVEDRRNRENFAAHFAEYSKLQPVSPDAMVLYIGKLNWPMPIPLVRKDGQWYFDTAAGKEEILNRRIGKNELGAIGVCRAYVEAQREYARLNPTGAPAPAYARRFMSHPGQKDGLYWVSTPDQPLSPLGPLVAQAQAEGYSDKPIKNRRPNQAHPATPYHGYYYQILESQGPHAPGGAKDYLAQGQMRGGFALATYPAKWGDSGMMTFIVNQDAIVYQKNLGPTTEQLAGQITSFDPDGSWTRVK